MSREMTDFAAGESSSFLITRQACLIILTLYVEKVEVLLFRPRYGADFVLNAGHDEPTC